MIEQIGKKQSNGISWSNEDIRRNPEQQVAPELAPLFDHRICKWPGCEVPLEDADHFFK